MNSGLIGTIDDWQTRLAQERAARKLLAAHNAPPVVDLKFRKQSHNATVFQGELDGNTVFLKHYQNDYGPVVTRKSHEETVVVRAQMDGITAGIVEILWTSEACAMVLMSAAPGRPVADALSEGKVAHVMPQVAHWLAAYIGPRTFHDTFSSSYWVKVRAAQDTSALSVDDSTLYAQGLDLQRARHAQHGTMPASKGRYPKDFAPHNLHWTGDAVWGFDIEGYTTNPIARCIALFCVVAERRLPAKNARLFGVSADCIGAFSNAIDLTLDSTALMPFVIMDEALKSLLKRHDDPVAGPATRRILRAQLGG